MEPPVLQPVTYRQAFVVWVRVACLSFGGPAGQIAVMHRILVEEKKWISESRFLHALNYCMLLPGPEAQQLATYIGWLLHGASGGLTAGLLFILPGMLAIMGLSIAYTTWHDTFFLGAVFLGLKPAVLAIVLEAVGRIGRRALKNRLMVGVATAAFLCIFVLNVPFPWIVIGAGLLGWVAQTFRPGRPVPPPNPGEKSPDPESAYLINESTPSTVRPTAWRAVLVVGIFGGLWALPLAILYMMLGDKSVYFRLGLYFSKAAVVTFGGAYAVLAYVAQEAVSTYGWLRPGEMLDGLGMAETTPGPLIMVLQFVGYMAAYRAGGGGLPAWLAGALGGLVTTWVTFVPCFLWVFLGAPYIERIRHHKRLGAAMACITAAVVGVILNLAVWFAVHTVFGVVDSVPIGPFSLQVPQWHTVSWFSAAIAAGAIVAVFGFRMPMFLTLGLGVAAGVVAKIAGG